MKKLDDIESLFSSVYAEEKAVPPTAVKSNIDAELFGGASSPRRLWVVLPILLVFFSTGLYLLLNTSVQNTTVELLSKESEISSTVSSQEINNGDELKSSLFDNGTIETALASDSVSELNLLNSELDIKSNRNELTNEFENDTDDLLSSENDSFTSPSYGSDSFGPQRMKDIRVDEKKKKKKLTFSLDNESLKPNRSIDRDITSKFAVKLVSFDDQVIEVSNNLENEAEEFENEIVGELKLKETKTLNNSFKPEIEYNKVNFNSSKQSRFELNTYAGLNVGVDFKAPTQQNNYLKERVGTQYSFEVSFALKPRMSLATGIDYLNYSDVYSETVTKTISTLDSSYYNYLETIDPLTQDTIMDSTLVNVFSTQDISSPNEVIINHTLISIPLYFQLTQTISPRLTARLSSGILVSYITNTVSGVDLEISLVKRHVGLSMMTRPEISYDLNHFSFGLYGRVGYDVIPLSAWGIANRKRFNLGAGLSIRYRF